MKITIDAQINEQQTEIWACGRVISKAKYCENPASPTCDGCMYNLRASHGCTSMMCRADSRLDGMAIIWEAVE